MTQRQLDLALLAGIGVLLVVILILALSGAPTTAGDISDPVDRVTAVESAEEGAAAEPASEPTPAVTTGDAADGAAADTAGTSEEGATTVTDEVEAVVGGETSSTQADETGADATGAAPPAGGVRLERIGFAYATGSEGACGVPLTAWGYVALSRDLLDDFPCGTAVTLTLDDEIAGRQSVTAQVGDTMGAGVTGTVNVFVGQDEPALEYGVTGGTLSP